jgi:hypothetical protein
MSFVGNGGSLGSEGGNRPPTPEEYRQRWEAQSKQMKPNDFERESEANKRQARKEVFQEAVRKAVEVKDERLISKFHDAINIEGR